MRLYIMYVHVQHNVRCIWDYTLRIYMYNIMLGCIWDYILCIYMYSIMLGCIWDYILCIYMYSIMLGCIWDYILCMYMYNIMFCCTGCWWWDSLIVSMAPMLYRRHGTVWGGNDEMDQSLGMDLTLWWYCVYIWN